MQHVISRRTLALASTAIAFSGFGILRARAEEPMRLRCSLDTAPSHLRNVAIADYLKKLEAASGGRIKAEIFHSGQLFADLDVSKALIQGQVEMAAPGVWTLTGFVPNADMLQLPAMYGRNLEETHRVIDGRAGAMVNAEVEKKLRVHMMPGSIDLGFQNWYTSKKALTSAEDLRGLKIRSPGGAGTSWRIRFFGGIPNVTAWPNVPLALSQGTFDGLVSTNQSLATGKLWEAGVRHAYEDHQFFGAYLPMVSNVFWEKLPPDLQKVMTDLWAQNISAYRAGMEKAQADSRAILDANGVKFVDPAMDVVVAARNAMMKQQDEMAREIKITPEMVRLVMQDLGVSSS